jgi:hypothetical protein
MSDTNGHLNLPAIVRKQGWDLLRPYKDVRLWLRDAPFIPGWARPFLKGSARVGAVAEWAFGPDV